MLEVLLLFAIILLVLYKIWTAPYHYWESKGYPQVPGEFPYGSSKELFTLSKYQGYIMEEFYKKMSGHPFYGMYIIRKPVLVLRDPEIIRLVMVKEFSHFRDRKDFKRSEKEFIALHLFNLEGERWRTLRVKLSPTFTSGKLKAMFPLFVNCVQELDNLLLTKLENTVDIKDITYSFTSDTICTCAFGIEVNALSNPDSQFKNLGIDIFKESKSRKLKGALMNLLPFLQKFFVPRFLPKYVEDFLLRVIKETVEHRKTNGIKRNDFLDLLISLSEQGTIGKEMKNEDDGSYGSVIEMTPEMMTAQCFVFFAAGFETSGSVQSYCLYEMALNPDIQERLHQEIVDTIRAHGELNYQAVMNMTYLDMVIQETLRKYPTLPILTRMCTKTFKFPTGHIIEEGTPVFIPVYTLHHDPTYFPKPEIFDPERFSQENKESIKPFTYLPFGEGPRICIGMRFGLLQTKMGIITILRKYRVTKDETTPVPINLKGSSLITSVKGPIKLKLSART